MSCGPEDPGGPQLRPSSTDLRFPPGYDVIPRTETYDRGVDPFGPVLLQSSCEVGIVVRPDPSARYQPRRLVGAALPSQGEVIPPPHEAPAKALGRSGEKRGARRAFRGGDAVGRRRPGRGHRKVENE